MTSPKPDSLDSYQLTRLTPVQQFGRRKMVLEQMLSYCAWFQRFPTINLERHVEDMECLASPPQGHKIVPLVPLPPHFGGEFWADYLTVVCRMIQLGPPLPVLQTFVPAQPQISTSRILAQAVIALAKEYATNLSLEAVPGNTAAVPQSWGFWLSLADRVYSIIEARLLLIEDLIVAAENSHLDNSFAWIVLQCLPIEHVKQRLADDLVTPCGNLEYGELFQKVWRPVELKPDPSSRRSLFKLRDSALPCLLHRALSMIDYEQQGPTSGVQQPARRALAFWRGLQQEASKEEAFSRFENSKRWYTNRELDYSQLNETKTETEPISILSNLLSTPIGKGILEYLTRPRDSDVLPLQVGFLVLLAPRTRARLLDGLEQLLFTGANIPVSIGLLETYIRLLYVAPFHSSEFLHSALQKCNNLQNFQILLELFSFRLFRYFAHSQSLRLVFLDLVFFHKDNPLLGNHQTYNAFQVLVLKLALQTPNIIVARGSRISSLPAVDFGKTLNRAFILGQALHFKVRGVQDFRERTEILKTLQKFYDQTPHSWSSNTLKHFPAEFQEFYRTRESAANRAQVPLTRVQTELFTNTTAFQQLAKYFSHFTAYYRNNPQNRPLFLCEVMLFLADPQPTETLQSLQYLSRVVGEFEPHQLADSVATLVNFLLDESPLFRPGMPLSQHDPSQPFTRTLAPGPQVHRVGQILASFVWQYAVLPLELLCLALLDRDDDPNSFLLLHHLLITDRTLLLRVGDWVQAKCALHWLEPNFAQKQVSLLKQFPVMLNLKPLPNLFGNICLRMLPVLDLALGRLIEHDKQELFESLVEQYAPLYQGHDSPLAFVSNFLLYYEDSTLLRSNPSLKLKLFKLLHSPSLQSLFSEGFSALLMALAPGQAGEPSEAISSYAYFDRLLQRVTLALDGSLAKVNQTGSLAAQPEQPFAEIPHWFLQQVQFAVIELLLSPLLPDQLVRQLVTVGLNTNPASAGCLLALLAPSHQQAFLAELASRVKSGGTDLRRLTQMATAFFYHASILLLAEFPSIIDLVQPTNLQQLSCLTQMVGPFIYRTHSNTDLLSRILIALAAQLPRVFPPGRPVDSVEPIEGFADLFCHCRHVFKLAPSAWAAVRRYRDESDATVRWLLKGI